MKTKRSQKRRVLKLNKKTIAHLNHFQMNGVKVGQYEEEEDIIIQTTVCTEGAGTCTPDTADDPLFPPLTFIKRRCTY